MCCREFALLAKSIATRSSLSCWFHLAFISHLALCSYLPASFRSSESEQWWRMTVVEQTSSRDLWWESASSVLSSCCHLSFISAVCSTSTSTSTTGWFNGTVACARNSRYHVRRHRWVGKRNQFSAFSCSNTFVACWLELQVQCGFAQVKQSTAGERLLNG